MLQKFGLTIILCMGILSCSRSEEGSSLNIVNGILLKPSEYPAVVKIRFERGEGRERSSFVCSASVVSSDTLLTAAHCAKGMNDMQGTALLGDRYVVKGVFYPHPNFVYVKEGDDPENAYKNFDVAFVKFPNKDSFEDIPPLTLSTTPPEPKDRFKILGFGAFKPGGEGGDKRLGFNQILSVNKDVINFVGGATPPDAVEDGAPVVALGEDARNVPGDSGGPMLNLANEIIGVSSTMSSEPVSEGKYSGTYANIQGSNNDEFVNSFKDDILGSPASFEKIAARLKEIDIKEKTCECGVGKNKFGIGCMVRQNNETIYSSSAVENCSTAQECLATMPEEMKEPCKFIVELREDLRADPEQITLAIAKIKAERKAAFRAQLMAENPNIRFTEDPAPDARVSEAAVSSPK